jgi:hypothetical protein
MSLNAIRYRGQVFEFELVLLGREIAIHNQRPDPKNSAGKDAREYRPLVERLEGLSL